MMIVFGDGTDAALSAPQRAVLALQAAWSGNRPNPALFAASRDVAAEAQRLYLEAARANIHLGTLIRRLHAQAAQERLTVAAWELEACHAGMLDELRWTLGEKADAKVARALEGGVALQCPRTLDHLDETTPAGRRAQVLNGSRDRLCGIVHRGYAAADIFESIQEELGADPLEPDLRALLEETLDTADDALFATVAWLGPVRMRFDAVADAEVRRLVEQ